jgi:thiamine kinase-like enzyme
MDTNPIESELDAIVAAVDAWRGHAVTLSPAAPGIVSPSHRGVDSDRWLVAIDGAPPEFLLKIVHPEHAVFFDVAASFDAQRSAAAIGCTPNVLHADPQRGAIVTGFLDGWSTARMDDLRKPEILARVIAAKSAIHAGPALSGTWTVFDRLRRFEEARSAAGVQGPDDLWWMLDAVADIEAAVLAVGWDAKPAHADGLASNVMISPAGDVRLVDFDEARNVDPHYELGILLNEAFQFESEMLPALEMAEGAVRAATLSRCRLYAVADDLAWGIWGLVMDATSSRGQIEFLKYANWRLLRCRMAIRHPGFEEKLRTV